MLTLFLLGSVDKGLPSRDSARIAKVSFDTAKIQSISISSKYFGEIFHFSRTFFDNSDLFCTFAVHTFIYTMEQSLSNALELFKQQRSIAESSKEQELSLEEINAEIRAVRKELRKK